jgi:hypothetical protein
MASEGHSGERGVRYGGGDPTHGRILKYEGYVVRDEVGFDCHRLTEVSPPHATEQAAWICYQDQDGRRCQVCGEDIEFWATFCRKHFAIAMRQLGR